jgi:hypothetical protein
MEMRMGLYKCLYAGCANYRKESEFKHPNPNCPECNQRMASAEPPVDPTFAEAVKKVRTKLADKWEASYQQKVCDNLERGAWFFRADFIDEMSKPTELAKFVDPTKRPLDPGKVCVDNALAAVAYAFPIWYPKGEKFTFELPYLLQETGFASMNDATDVFKTSFKALAGKVANGQMVLVVAKKESEKIGHMVVITTDGQGNAFLTDAQKLAFDYGLYNHIAWRYGAAPVAPPRPCKPVTLSTGKLSGSWTL